MPCSLSTEVLVTNRGLVESPRWHGGRFWFADWTAGEILSMAEDGSCQVVARAPAPPLSFDFARDGSLQVVSSAAGQLLKQTSDGQLVAFPRWPRARCGPSSVRSTSWVSSFRRRRHPTPERCALPLRSPIPSGLPVLPIGSPMPGI